MKNKTPTLSRRHFQRHLIFPPFVDPDPRLHGLWTFLRDQVPCSPCCTVPNGFQPFCVEMPSSMKQALNPSHFWSPWMYLFLWKYKNVLGILLSFDSLLDFFHCCCLFHNQGACGEPILGAGGSRHAECSLITRIFLKNIRMFVNMETFRRSGRMNNASDQLGVAQRHTLGESWSGIETHSDYESICQTSCPLNPFISPHLRQRAFQQFFLLILWVLSFSLLCCPLLSCRTSACWNASGLRWRAPLFSFWILSPWDVIISMVRIHVELARPQRSTL